MLKMAIVLFLLFDKQCSSPIVLLNKQCSKCLLFYCYCLINNAQVLLFCCYSFIYSFIPLFNNIKFKSNQIPQRLFSFVKFVWHDPIATSLSDVREICLDTLLYIDGVFTVSVIPFIVIVTGASSLCNSVTSNILCKYVYMRIRSTLFSKEPFVILVTLSTCGSK